MKSAENRDTNGDIASEIELNLVVLYADDLQSARQFYSTLGCRFQLEKHGSGPEHYSAVLGRTVFELYPGNHRATGRTRIGFRVRSMDQTLESLRAQDVKVLSAPRASEWGRRAVVEDPMGNCVELIESAVP
jgi:lactoylglutathione lyase